jgi:predicted MFS family arabinose efflux permease
MAQLPPTLHLFANTFAALRYPNFRKVWIGSFLSNMGTWVQKIAQPWVILELTGSAFLLGMDSFLQDAPLLFFLLIGGVLVDRLDKRRVLILSQMLQLTAALLIAALIWTKQLHVGVILSVSFVIGCMQAVSTPAYLALIPTLVEKEHLSNAIALNSTQFNLSRLIGPVIGGIIIVSLGAAWCFGLNALSFIATIIALASLTAAMPAKKVTAQVSILESVREGVRAIYSRRDLTSVILLVFGVSFFAGPVLTFIPVMAKEVLQVEAQGFSILISVFGAGAVTGALLVASLKPPLFQIRFIFRAALCLSGAVMLFAWSSWIAVSLVILFAAGFTFVTCNSMSNTIVQTSIAESLRGRAMSIFALAFRGGLPLGSLLTGTLTHYIGVQRALAISGIGFGVIIFFVMRYAKTNPDEQQTL